MFDQLRRLAVFTTVAEEGSFRSAARKLGQSPSVISHHVSSLEEEFGLALIYRTTRRLSLTSQGLLLAAQGRQMLDAAESGLQVLSSQAKTPSGRLKMVVPTLLQEGPFIGDVVRFMTLYPGVEVVLEFSDIIQSLIPDGIDLALSVSSTISQAKKVSRVVGGTQVLCASPTYLANSPPISNPEDLPLDGFVKVSGTPDFILRKGDAERAIRVGGRMSVGASHAARSFALNHFGFVILPHFFVKDYLADGTLEKVLPDWQPPNFEFSAFWPENVGIRSLATLFVDFLLSELKKNPPLVRRSVAFQSDESHLIEKRR